MGLPEAGFPAWQGLPDVVLAGCSPVPAGRRMMVERVPNENPEKASQASTWKWTH